MACCCCCFGTGTRVLKMGGGMPGASSGAHWNMRSVMYTEHFLPASYAWVTVDVRGTGASEGRRPVDLHPDEYRDIATVLKWVVAQSWCNGQVFSTGISYDGMSAVMLASHRLPATLAIAPLFAPVDLYDEISHPGGVRCIGFTNEYSKFVHNLERNTPGNCDYPLFVKVLVNVMMNGVRTVNGDRERLTAAVAQHHDNWDMLRVQKNVLNRDDEAVDGLGIDDISVHRRMYDVAAAAATTATLFVSGYYDSGSALGAIRGYLTQTSKWQATSGTPHPRLLLGPWNHGARNNSSPFTNSHTPSFPLVPELIRFFNHVRRRRRGGDDGDDGDEEKEWPVRYFTVGEECWKASATWPPPNTTIQHWAIGANGVLSHDTNTSTPRTMDEEVALPESKVSAQHAYTEYTINPNATSGELSRWNLVKHMFKIPIVYDQRHEQDRMNLVLDSPSLSSWCMEVTGHPFVTLYTSTDADDVAVFVYLEEVMANGRVVYITEGQLRLSARAISSSSSSPHYVDCVPYRSYLRADQRLLAPDEPVRAVIPLLPVSYRFSAGSCVRLSIACADKDNFDLLPGAQATRLRVYLDGLSYLALPLVVVE